MRITPLNKYLSLLLIVGGIVFTVPPLFAQYTIDLTYGICSGRFLRSAEDVAAAYHRDLGAPGLLADMIDSSFAERDLISAITYIYIAHLEAGLEDTYLADIARTLAEAGCLHLPDSLFELHLSRNPADDDALGDYAILLARRWRFKKARELLENRIRKARGAKKSALSRDLGMVHLLEFVHTGNKKALDKAFSRFREAKFGADRRLTTMKRGLIEFHVDAASSSGDGIYNFTVNVEHAAGSDALIIGLGGSMVFGRELESRLPGLGPIEAYELLGSIYISPGETLRSETGAFEVVGDLGRFAPFYEVDAKLRLRVVYPDGSQQVYHHEPLTVISSGRPLRQIYDALAYDQAAWACSVLTAYADSGESLPERWAASTELAAIIDDPDRWENGIRIVDSLIDIRLDANLWVYKGALLYLLGRPKEAVHPLVQAVEADPNNSWAIYNLALVRYDLGEKETAAELFLEAASLNPRIQPALALAGVIYEEIGRLDLALEYYELSIRASTFRSDEVADWAEQLDMFLNSGSD